IMLAEVIFYAIVGGAVGLLLGRVLMGVAAKALLPMTPNAVTYPFWKFLVSYIIAIAVSVLATLVPIISVSKKTVRELTGEGFKVIKPVNLRLFIAITVLVVAICVAYAFLKGIALLILSVALIIAIAFWIYCAIYFVIGFVGKMVRKLAKGGAPYLAGVSVTRNSAMHTVTTLIAVVIAFSFLIVEVVGIVQDAVIPFRERFETDYVVSANTELKLDEYDLIKDTALNIYGVDGAGWYNATDFKLKDGKECTLYGVDGLWMMECCSTVEANEIEKAWNSVENPLVLNQNITTIYGWEVGDTITVTPLEPDYKDETLTFTIVGIDRSVTRWDMIGFCKFEALYRINKYGTFFVKEKEGLTEKESSEVFIDLRDDVENLGISLTYALDYEEWAYAETDGYEGVGSLLTILQVLVWFVSLMGVANISIVTVYDRRAEYRLYKVSGMAGNEYVKFSVFEGIIVGLAGGILGFIAGYGVNMLVPSLATIIGRYSAFNILPWQLFLNFGIGVGAFLLLWTLIALVNRKNTVKSINERNLLN
ncbi:MAG: ABC transporter permease, partial [Clostridia bacterium]|nr:ABC transporter permease [Clostridia bacterium]